MEHLEEIRSYELYKAISHMPKSGNLLEVGAGSGWQAKLLSNEKYEVFAIDIKPPKFTLANLRPITIYDGTNIPFSDDFFDILFSSNTLEHINDIDSFLRETSRVTKDGGMALHILPTPTWRLWTTTSHHTKIIIKIFNIISNRIFQREPERIFENPDTKGYSTIMLALRILIPPRHGERGNAFSEIFFYRKKWWKKAFEKAGWEVVETFPLQLFYTGNSVLGNKLSITKRCLLSKILGSSTTGYLLKKPEHSQAKT